MPFSFALRDIDFAKATQQEINQLALSIEHDPELKFIHFTDIDLGVFNFVQMETMLAAIKNNKATQTISLSRCCLENASSECLNLLSTYLKSKRTLDISFHSLKKPGPWLDFIKDVLDGELEFLEFSYNWIGLLDNNANLQKLFCLFANSNLNKLLLRGNIIGSNDCKQALLNLFSGKIKYLDLADNLLGCSSGTKPKDWNEFFDMLQKNKFLKGLNLTDCGLDLLTFPEEYGDDDEDYIETDNVFSMRLLMFVKQTSLEELNLSKNDFTESFTIKLIEAAHENPRLKFVCEDNGLSKEAIAALTQTLKEKSQSAAGGHEPSSMKSLLTFSDPLKAVENQDNGSVVSPQAFRKIGSQ